MKLGIVILAVALPLLVGCGAVEGASDRDGGNSGRPDTGAGSATGTGSPEAEEVSDSGDRIFAGGIVDPASECAQVKAAATTLLAAVEGSTATYDVADKGAPVPHGCGFQTALPDLGSAAIASLSVFRWELDNSITDPTYAQMITSLKELAEEVGMDEADFPLREQISEPGWTYGWSSFESLAGVEDAYGQVSLVYSTDSNLLECAYRAPSERPPNFDLYRAACQSVRDLAVRE